MIRQYKIVELGQRLRWTALVTLGLLVVTSPILHAQGVTTPEPVEFSVTELPSSGRLINLPVNKGALVDFNVPLREVRIANPDIADVAVTATSQILISGKSFGSTQLVVWTDGDKQHVFDVAVDLDLERLQASIRSTVPRARVHANSVLDTVVLSGMAPDVESAQQIAEIAAIYSANVVNHIRVAGMHQVMLRCTVAEVNRSATRQLGFNGWMAGDNFGDVFAVNQLDGINPVNIGAAGSSLVSRRIPFATDQDGLSLSATPTLSLGFPRLEMQIFLQALRENGLVKILAEPNLVTVSGQQADFLAGGEFPVPVPQRDAVTIEYREFGVRLRFTPVVLSENTIRLRVAPEVSEPDYSTSVTLGGFVIPGLIQRRIETTVELGNGQTFAIGGLLSEKVRSVSRKIPGLGDLPILGPLFSSVDYQTEESELVVLVTPELVAPLLPDQIRYIPGADLIPPNDAELFMEGRLEGRPAKVSVPPEQKTPHVWPSCSADLYGPTVQRMHGPIGPAGSEEGS